MTYVCKIKLSLDRILLVFVRYIILVAGTLYYGRLCLAVKFTDYLRSGY